MTRLVNRHPPASRLTCALGTQISDCKPRPPAWSSVSVGGDNPATAIAAWPGQVLLGDKEGGVHCWHTATGAVHSFATNQARP